MTPEEVLKFARDNRIEYVDLRFLDLPGRWQHLTVPIAELTLRTFQDGVGFDGYALRGWQEPNASDMLITPVAETMVFDPFCQHPTIAMICDVKDPVTRAEHPRDPRAVARRAEAYMRSTGIADSARFGPELEFFIFDKVHYDQGINYARYELDSREGIWRRGRDELDNLGNQLRSEKGGFSIPPVDSMHSLRAEMVAVLQECGIAVEKHHHAAATGGQARIVLRPAPLVQIGDKVVLGKYVVKNVAARHGKVVTFMPQPLYGDNGSGMHTHFSLWKGDTALFGGDKYAELSECALQGISGLMEHAGAILAFTNPTTNSYKRLVRGCPVPGCEAPGRGAPVNLMYSTRSRSAFVRVPAHRRDPEGKRLELRFPDPSCNPYLAFSAILMAALDGIQRQIDPGPPIDEDLHNLPAEERARMNCTPSSLGESLAALERDHQFLLQGGVFTEDAIRHWIRHKLETEVSALRSRPHPYEFCLYFDL